MAFWKKKDNLIITVAVAIFFVCLGCWPNLFSFGAVNASTPPSPAFQVPFNDKHGNSLTLHKFRGQPLIVNFWATWCPVCVQRMASFNTFAKAFEAQGGKVICVSEDGSLETANEYIERNGYTNLPAYLDNDGQLMTSLGVAGLPTAIFINAEGQEVDRLVGGMDWRDPTLHDVVFKHFAIRIPAMF